MTRFMLEYSGELGDFWKKHAEKEVEKVRNELENGEITIDENGIARNSIGRVLMDDLAEIVSIVTDRINFESTRAAYDDETGKIIEVYKASRMNKGYSEEEKAEMRAAFGEGAVVVNILTGQKIIL